MSTVDTDTRRTADDAYQERILQGVSRTFALTIPVLPVPLAAVVGNGYLLCRIADTIEDDAALGREAKRRFTAAFVDVVEGRGSAEDFAAALHPRLGPTTLEAERDLIRNVPVVIRILRRFSAAEQQVLARCVRVMARGMAEFQQRASRAGLADVAELDRYCYHVAGVVGEMLTELFCLYSPEAAGRRDALLSLAVSFGQGLQMTNILKDQWDDYRRGACWLPRSLFLAHGVELSSLEPGCSSEGYRRALAELIGIARHHLANALTYTLLLPASERGMRCFCLWALGMAVLTLRKIHARLDFQSGDEVKIRRISVKATVLVTRASVAHDGMLRFLFAALTRSLPTVPAPLGSAVT